MNSLFDIFNFAFVKEQLKRFWAIGALSFIVCLLSCILPFLSADPSEYYVSRFMIMIIEMKYPALIILNVAVPLITAASLFSFMYHPNSTAALHSLPLRKRTIFASNFLAGFILIAVPLLLLCVLLALNPIGFSDFVHLGDGTSVQAPYEPDLFFPAGLQPLEIINTVPVLFFFFIRLLISFMFYFCLFILASALAGTQVFYILLCIILPFVPAALYLAFGLISYVFIFGFYFHEAPLLEVFFYSSPTLAASAEEFKIGLGLIYTFYFFLAAAILSLSVFLFHIRRQERAGEGLVFEKFRGLFVFLCSFGAMMFGAAFFFALWNQIFFTYLGALIGFAIGHIIARMLTERTFNIFNNFYPFLRHGAVLVLCFLAILIISAADIGGYSGRVPEESDIAGVYFGYPHRYYNGYANDTDKRLIQNPSVISRTLSVHTALIENKSQAYSLFSGNLHPRSIYLPNNAYISYQLKNGGHLSRYYDIPESLAEESGLNALLNEEDVILSDYYWLKEPEKILSVTFTVYDNSGDRDAPIHKKYEIFSEYPPLISSAEDIASFLAAARQDYVEEVQNGTIHDGALSIGIDFELKEEHTVGENMSQPSYHLRLGTGKNVLKWLDNFTANGLILTSEIMFTPAPPNPAYRAARACKS